MGTLVYSVHSDCVLSLCGLCDPLLFVESLSCTLLSL